MKKQSTRIRKRIPIRRQFQRTVLLTTIISILAVSITGYFCIRWIRSTSEQTLSKQLELNLKALMSEKVDIVNAKLERYEKYVTLITDTVSDMYANRKEMVSQGRMLEPPKDTREYAITRAFAAHDLKAADMREEILFFSNLESLWAPIAKENKALVSTIYLGTKDGLLVSYDRYSYLSCPPKGQEYVYNYFVSEWYKKGMQAKGVFYTDVYMDFQGRGLTVTVGSPVKDSEGNVTGVACMDFDLSELYEELFAAGLGDGSFIFTLDQDGTIISPDSDMLDLQTFTGLTLDELDELRASEKGFLETDDALYVCVPIEHLDWTMCARIPKSLVRDSIHAADPSIRSAALVFLLVVLLILLAAVVAVNRSVRSITHPLELLEKDIKIITDGDLDYRATVHRNDEIGDITSGMNAMVDRLNFTMKELMSSQQQVDAMSKLATLDSLTGVKNKTAFDREAEGLEEAIRRGEAEFGYVLLDLNNLKLINDNYGHEKGDVAIKTLCGIVCEVFHHSPVFRVGGDEFVVILRGEDYGNIHALVASFKEKIADVSEEENAEPWERVTAAIGYAVYDEQKDSGTESVLSRADKAMYRNKKLMKGSWF